MIYIVRFIILVTVNNKGEYKWPGSITGNIVTQPCINKESSSAHYYCEYDGKWTHLNTTACPYFSETTKVSLERSVFMNILISNVISIDAGTICPRKSVRCERECDGSVSATS